MRIFKQAKWLLVALFLLSVFQQLNIITPVSATSIASSTIRYVDDWLEYVVGDMDETDIVTTDTLTMYEIGEMRVRDIKRRLQRTHGYGADEVSRMLDKRELINTLAFEEHKTRQRRIEKEKRRLLKRGIIGALISVLVVMCWPLLSHAWEAGTVNLVVFADRKKFEATRCYELQSWSGFVGIVLMAVIDLLQVWLRASVLLSWVMTSKYFFPIPSLTVHPARFMGGQVASGPMAKYGFNMGPMILTWLLRFVNGYFEKWTGKALAKAQREQKKRAKAAEETETPWEREERKARKAARKAAREAAREEAEAASEAAAAAKAAERDARKEATANDPIFPEKEKPRYETASVEQFLSEGYKMDASDPVMTEPEPSGFDELD